VDVEREREDGEGGEEDEGVHEDGLAVGVEAAEVDVAVGARELAQQARGEQHEEHHAHHHGAPVRHASPRRRAGAWRRLERGRSVVGLWMQGDTTGKWASAEE